MSTLSPERWQEISPYLDHALSLTEQDRAAWFETFQLQRPELAELLKDLLNEHSVLANEHFLEGVPLESVKERPLTARTVGAYRLISRIGQGGMGSVWLAERSDGRFERQVAVKFLNFALAAQGAVRFKREGSILGRLTDPHIAELIDAGVTSNGEPYLVLEHVDGTPIDKYCDDHALEVNARIRLFLDVLGAVAHAHANLIVHRDIKPSNVLVRNDGQVKLLDFGIAKLLADEVNPAPLTALTMDGGGAMTPQFAAPEQVSGRSITTATDVYSLGVLLYLLLTGQHPAGPASQSPADLFKSILDTEPPRASDAITLGDAKSTAQKRTTTPEKLRHHLRGDLDTIIGKAMKKNPAERYASATVLADDLCRYLKHEPISARPDALAYRTAKFVRRNRTAVALGSVALLVAIAGVAGILLQARSARLQRDAALRERDRANRVAGLMSDMFTMQEPDETRGNTVTAREILDRASKQSETSLAKDPDLQAQMMCTMGKTYTRLGLYSAARPLMERGIEIGRRANGPTSPVVLNCANELAFQLIQEGRFAESDKLLQEALAIELRTLGGENPLTLDTTSTLAVALLEERRTDEALNLASQAYQIRRRLEGEEAVGTLWSMDVYTTILTRTRHLTESQRLLKEQLEFARRIHGSDSSEALSSMDNLGATLVLLGRLPEAEDMLRQTLDVRRRVFGSKHPDTGRTLYNLACVAARQDHRDEAFSYLRESVEVVYVRTLLSIEKDSDLTSLQTDPRWVAVIAVAKKRIAAAQESNRPGQ